MEQGDVVPLGDMPEGTFFWDNDGDLSVVIPHEGSQNGKCSSEICCRYWSSSSGLSRRDITKSVTRKDLPDPETGQVIHWSPEYEWQVVMLPEPPITDEEVQEALASIAASLRGRS